LYRPELVFLALRTRDATIMRAHVNRRWKRLVGRTIVALSTGMSAVTIAIAEPRELSEER